ncbi:hypothetical protein [Terrimonas pollutisoli]|uniref:hypothetical protein n=1 Tax=Terrimonas pollutisoli TaxID=3034147 RepID=UPI0023ECFCFE|nr:hypothetical protein [Terrimonas sp. H1YJ31]
MKSMLFAAAALMIGASIYGFVDYKKTARTERFRKMYEEKKETPVITTPPIETKLVSPEKTDVKEKEISPAEKSEKTTSSSFKTRKVKGVKKLNYKEFSRAPLREEQEVVQPEKSNN